MARKPRTELPAQTSRSLAFPAAIRIRARGIRSSVRTLDEALDMIERELPAELRRLPRWTFARALLEEARRTQRKRDLLTAARQLRQALSNEKWLADEAAGA
ncbi:MAG TPA: hypothetical protein VLX44_05340 [Xanthobacteraceae bacterium]|nr:hypothetical protein [Xanthobacteraceae bacterium]